MTSVFCQTFCRALPVLTRAVARSCTVEPHGRTQKPHFPFTMIGGRCVRLLSSALRLFFYIHFTRCARVHWVG